MNESTAGAHSAPDLPDSRDRYDDAVAELDKLLRRAERFVALEQVDVALAQLTTNTETVSPA